MKLPSFLNIAALPNASDRVFVFLKKNTFETKKKF